MGRMRRGCIPLLLMAAVFVQAQSDSPVIKPAAGLSIPAELTKTVRADKAQRGDPVEFTSQEAVLIGQGLVMPPHSKLFGRIVGAAPRQGDKPSWLVLLVEKAEWKQHSVLLHAFISSQITFVPAANPDSAGVTTARNVPPRTSRARGRTAAQSETSPSSLAKVSQDAAVQSPGQVMVRVAILKDVRILRDKDGTSYLFSTKSNVKLPRGTLFMLQNCPPSSPEQSAAAGPH